MAQQTLSTLGYLVHGMGLGASIALPLGPMKILCLRRVIAYGALAGCVTAAGVVSGDTIFIAIAALGLTAVTAALHSAGAVLRVVGGLALLWLALRAWLKPLPKADASLERSHYLAMYAGTVGLTLTNPQTIVMFITVLMSAGGLDALTQTGAELVPVGMVLGSALVWTFFAAITIAAGRRLTPARLGWLNRAAAVLLFYFGASALWAGFKAYQP